MIHSLLRMSIAVLLAGLCFVTPSVASDRAALMREFGVTPMGLKPSPPFTLKGVGGNLTALADYRGRPVLLYFWATW